MASNAFHSSYNVVLKTKLRISDTSYWGSKCEGRKICFICTCGGIFRIFFSTRISWYIEASQIPRVLWKNNQFITDIYIHHLFYTRAPWSVGWRIIEQINWAGECNATDERWKEDHVCRSSIFKKSCFFWAVIENTNWADPSAFFVYTMNGE